MYLWDNFDFFGYKIHKITYSLDPIIPYLTDIGRHCSRYRYSDSSIFIFDAFQNLYCNIFAKPIRYIGLLHSTTLGSLSVSSFILLRDNSFIMYVSGAINIHCHSHVTVHVCYNSECICHSLPGNKDRLIAQSNQ